MVLTGRASFAQERLYFLHQLEPENSAYVVAFAVRLDGTLDHEALAESLRRVVARHPALRTTYAMADGLLWQEVHEDPCLDLDVQICEWVNREAQERALHDLVTRAAARPFSLAEGPIMRAAIRSWAPDQHALVVLVHHIACDGWSVGILLRDLAAEYNARVSGMDTQWPGPAESYLDYAQVQRAMWERDSTEVEYWRQTLAGAPQLSLLTDHPRPSVLDSQGEVLRRPIEPELVHRLGDWARPRGATLFHVALAAYAWVLTRYARQDEVVIGIPVANRLDEAAEEIVGCLVNTLPVRIEVAGAPAFTQLVERVRTAVLSAFARQDMPFEQIVAASAGERRLSRAPLFQTTLTLQNFPFEFPEFEGLKLSEVDVEIESTKFDIGLTLDVSTDRPFLRAEYSTRLFEPDTVSTLMGHYLRLLESIVDGSDEPSMVDKDERHHLTIGVNPQLTDAPAEYPSVLRRFEGHARRSPAAVAVRHQGNDLTYAEMDAWATRIAAGLLDSGVSRGDLIGLLLCRSPAAIAAILGIWKIGATYVPLDPEYPRQRLELIVASAGMDVMLIEPGTAESARTLADDRDMKLIDVHTVTGESPIAETPLGPDELAYIIYTSGSTGIPKGVMVSRQGVDALFTPRPGTLDISDRDVWLCAHSFSFDFSVWEVWGALTSGGRLVIADQVDLVDPHRLARLVHTEGISVLSQTPGALYRLLPPYLERLGGDLSSIRFVVLGGEALSWSRLSALVVGHDGMQANFVNMYGITEGTIHVTIVSVPAADLAGIRDGNIGHPLPSGRCYVLDSRHEPTGIDVPGELYCGGVLVAKGYVNDPELTSARFIPDPYGSGNMYRTGDVVKWDTDGNMVYLGRNDNQVQLRGFRVECSEVEGAILQHPAVRACVATVDAEELVAFVCCDLESDAERQLRAYVKDLLPSYMVPSRILTVPAIPLTAHGKVDTARLAAEGRALRQAPTRASERLVTTGTSIEEAIRALWADVLGRGDVGLSDNFFDLGGHSFALISLQQRMSEAGFDMSVTDLFQAGTVAACAAHVQQTAPQSADEHLEQRHIGRQLLAARRKRAAGGQHD